MGLLLMWAPSSPQVFLIQLAPLHIAQHSTSHPGSTEVTEEIARNFHIKFHLQQCTNIQNKKEQRRGGGLWNFGNGGRKEVYSQKPLQVTHSRNVQPSTCYVGTVLPRWLPKNPFYFSCFICCQFSHRIYLKYSSTSSCTSYLPSPGITLLLISILLQLEQKLLWQSTIQIICKRRSQCRDREWP